MKTKRRQFIKTGIASTAGVVFAGNTLAFNSSSGIMGSNDTVNVAVIGVKGHGITHINAYKNNPKVKIVALCDVDSHYLNMRLNDLRKENINAKGYKDLRALFEDKNVDAVSIATPNHWHALATVWACQAGKHVCVEKPVSHSIWEGRKMVEASRKYNRLVQADLDTRSNLGYDEAFDYMHKEMGKVLLVRIVNYKRRKSIGKIMGPGIIPHTLDYNIWTGPNSMKPLLRENLHYDWHWQWATGNSELGNNGPHQLDTCRRGLRKKSLPGKVFSFGGRYGYQDDGETPNTQVSWYDYDGIPVIYDSRGLGETPGTDNMDGINIYTATGKKINHPYTGTANCSIAFICENGYLYEMSLYDNDGNKVKDFTTNRVMGPQDNFINAIRNNDRNDLKIDILEGHLSATLSHMGNISYQTGSGHNIEEFEKIIKDYSYLFNVYKDMKEHCEKHSIDFNKEKIIFGKELSFNSTREQFEGDHSEVANLFVKDIYREPFVIPEKV